jgi:hypothetical protein
MQTDTSTKGHAMPADTPARDAVEHGPAPHAPPHAPKTRDEVVQENRRRRETEPAVAPIEADGEAGNPTGRHGGDPLPRDPAGRPRDPAAEAPRRDPADIPAGPGDAGAQSAPRTLPEELQRDRGGWGRSIAVFSAGAVLILLVAALV